MRDYRLSGHIRPANYARYSVEIDNERYILLRDEGPHDVYKTITNAAERVVIELIDALEDRRLFYIDSEDRIDELCIRDGRFSGFAPARSVCCNAKLQADLDGALITCYHCDIPTDIQTEVIEPLNVKS